MNSISQFCLNRRSALIATVSFGATLIAWPAIAAGRVAKSKAGVAIKGYDTTAYFSVGSAKPGTKPNSVDWNGATWLFATSEDAAKFAASPEAFAPQFGGFCTRAMSLKKVVPADPEVWRIHGEKLYMFARPVGGTFFDKGPDAMIKKAQAHWETL